MKPTLAVCIGAFEYGGQGTVVEQELVHLSDRFKVTLFAERIERPVPAAIDVRTVPAWGPFPRPNAALIHALGSFALIHCHDSLGFMAAAHRSGRPWIVTCHGICPPRFRSSLGSKAAGAVTLALYPRLYRHASAVVPVSTFLGDWVRRFAHIEPAVIPLGVSVVDPGPHVVPASQRLLYVGEISPRKGVADLLVALREAPKSVSVDLVGRGEVPRFRRLANRLGLDHRVQFVGEVPQEQLARLYGECFATCSASHWEGYGLPVLEGFARGRPAIVRAQGGMLEQVQQSGAGRTFTNPNQFRRCLEEVARDWETLSRAATTFASERLWSSTFDRYDRLFRDLLGSSVR